MMAVTPPAGKTSWSPAGGHARRPYLLAGRATDMQEPAMQAQARHDGRGEPTYDSDPERKPPPRLVRIVAPGVCWILVEPADIARVLAARPGARMAPLSRRSA
jgi:hypothetical protein